MQITEATRRQYECKQIAVNVTKRVAGFNILIALLNSTCHICIANILKININQKSAVIGENVCFFIGMLWAHFTALPREEYT